jgi:hypothetical protein
MNRQVKKIEKVYPALMSEKALAKAWNGKVRDEVWKYL